MTHMRAVTVTGSGELAITTRQAPDPAPGEVVLAVTAAGLNRADLLQRHGHYPPPPGVSDVMGLEISGIVVELGAGVDIWEVGDQACALLAGGGYAERVAVPARQLLPVPSGLSLVEAAALPEAVCTAWSNLVDVGRLRAGETVLVHGGSGGVGTIATQLAAAVGARVLTTAGTAERATRCAELGADVVIDHRTEDFGARVDDVTDGRGVDVILDVIGGPYLERNVRALGIGGRLVVIGLQQGRTGELDLGALLTKRASVHGTTLRARPADEKAAIVSAVREHVWPWIAAGAIRPIIDTVFPLGDAEHAQRLLSDGKAFGKILLTLDD